MSDTNTEQVIPHEKVWASITGVILAILGIIWIGAFLGILNFGTSTSWSKWWTFSEIFGSHYKELASFKKPMMIAEFGCLKSGGDRAKWFGDALRNFQKNYPLVNSIVFFHYSGDKTTSDKSVNWYIKIGRAHV